MRSRSNISLVKLPTTWRFEFATSFRSGMGRVLKYRKIKAPNLPVDEAFQIQMGPT